MAGLAGWVKLVKVDVDAAPKLFERWPCRPYAPSWS
jgi:hypothetical protein